MSYILHPALCQEGFEKISKGVNPIEIRRDGHPRYQEQLEENSYLSAPLVTDNGNQAAD